ncbi:hypothetical protein N7523_005566 [Penicillium sp. IBT 18751x]|nr:hypothetical protein N7523_005848 [Penicillium sp. IBT 18751x]KAJ6117815.1 hypothetical protein N7523_005566 [Penicillium sp. IBT 18751x]
MSFLKKFFRSGRQTPTPTHQDPSFYPKSSQTRPEAQECSFQIQASNKNDLPPVYSPGQTSVDIILDNIRQSNRLDIFAEKGAFNVLRSRTFHVHLDCNKALQPNTRQAILLMAKYLLLIAKTYDCEMTFFFIGYPNQHSPHLSDEDKGFLTDLLKVWFTESFVDASTLVENNSRLSALGKWMKDPTTFRADVSSDDKHTQLLTHVQEMMLPYNYGWHQRDLQIDQVPKLVNSAFQYSQKQRKCLNQVRFTFQREIKRYQRMKEQDTFFPFTALFLMGAPLHEREVQAIKECQGAWANTTKDWLGRQPKQLGQQLKLENEFQISTAVFRDYLNENAITLYREIDKSSFEDDVNDLIVFSEGKILQYLPHPHAWFKYLNCHNKRVDRFDLKTTNTYDTSRLCVPGTSIIEMPTVPQVRDALELEDLTKMPVVDDEFLNPPPSTIC